MAKAKKKSKGQADRQRQQQAAAARRSGSTPSGRDRQQAQPARAEQATPAVPEPQPPVLSAERWYLDVFAVRIQEWLARTPDLKFRRGASILLSEATAPDDWEGRLPPGTQWNPEAGSVDGVVSLILTGSTVADATEGDEKDPAQAARQAAGQVIARLRERMPSLHLQAVAGYGASYAGAYEEMKRLRRNGTVLIDSPPAPQELVLAKPCDQCRSTAAVRHENGEPGNTGAALCRDCRQRRLRAGGARRPPRPERELIAALKDQQGMEVTGLADDFAEVAEGGRFRKDDAATQMALIYADGNRVGDFIRKITAARRSRIPKSEIARLIDDATIGALADAVADRFPGWKRPKVIAHIAGGDDLLVSVPAPEAWQFTRALLTAFSTRMGKAAPGGVPAPTLAAGLIFAHRSHPFSDQVRIAETELRAAKRHTRGSAAAVSFWDLTADGSGAPPDRTPVTLDRLTRLAPYLQAAEQKIPANRRQALLALFRQDAAEEAIWRLTDFDDNRPLWEAVAGPGATADQTRKQLASDEAARGELRQLLDIGRHWHTLPRQETP